MAQTGGSSTAIPDPENMDDAVSAAGNAAAADDKEERKARRNRMRMVAECKRRKRVKDYFGELQALMPHVPDKSGRNTIVQEAIEYIKFLEQTMAMLEKRAQELAFARKAAAEAGASSSSAPPPPPQAATQQGVAAAMLCSDVVPEGCHDVPPRPPQPLDAADMTMSLDIQEQEPLVVAVVPAAPPQFPMAAAGLAGFQTWSWPNLVVSVSNDNASIKVCVPRHLGRQNMAMVLSVLNKNGIHVVTAHGDSDAVSARFIIYTRVTRMGGENPSSEEVYKLAMSEILLWLNTD